MNPVVVVGCVAFLRVLRNNLRIMRKTAALNALFPSVRGNLLAATLTQSDKWWYLSELAEFLHTTPSSLQRELKALVNSGILQQRREGTRIYFKAETQSPLFPELRGLLEKTAGLLPTLQQALEPLKDRIDCAFVYGSVARRQEHARSDVDLLVIGIVGQAELAPAVRKAEGRLGREVNVTSFAASEFRKKWPRGIFSQRFCEVPRKSSKESQRDLDEAIGIHEVARHGPSKKSSMTSAAIFSHHPIAGTMVIEWFYY